MKDSERSLGQPEPIPDWKEEHGQIVWRWALPAHCYVFGTIFFAVALYGVYNLVKICQTQMRKSRNYFICIAVLVCMFGSTRALVLLTDPYSTGKPLQVAPGYGLLLFSLGYPCLTSGFFLINWTLVEVTKLQLLPSRIHKRKVLGLVLVVHFVVVITFDTIFVSFPNTHILLFICRSFFVLWGMLLFGGFIIAAVRIHRQVKQTLRSINTISNTVNLVPRVNTVSFNTRNTHVSVGIETAGNMNRLQQARCMKVTRVACRAAAAGLLICCTQIYALWEFYVFYNNDIVPKAWPWWIYQTCFRCIEVFMVSQMFLVIRPKK